MNQKRKIYLYNIQKLFEKSKRKQKNSPTSQSDYFKKDDTKKIIN